MQFTIRGRTIREPAPSGEGYGKTREAHKLNDKAVMQAYGMPIKETDEAACVAWLVRMYQEMTS